MNESISVRPFESSDDFQGMIDYFLGGDEAFKRGMGIEPGKLLSRVDWLRSALEDFERPDAQKQRFCIAWCQAEHVVGHSSISHIEYGQSAHCHLHLWNPALRGAGLGPKFLRQSIDIYFNRFELKVLASEPYAHNPGPSSLLPKLGFRQVRQYITTPTSMCFEQLVTRFELNRQKWLLNLDEN